MSTKTLPAALTIRALGDESEITITTPGRDLMADTIDPMGMDVSRYLSGTRAVNFAHDHGRLPVGKTLSLSQTPSGIRARFRWLDSNPEARVVKDVFADGVLGASVEFVPVEREPNRSGGLHFAKSILTGWALTANPANPECVRMLKSLRLDRDEPVLYLIDDDEPTFTVDPVEVAQLVRQHVGSLVDQQVRRQTQDLLGLAPSPSVVVRDDAGDTWRVDAATLQAAWAEVLGTQVTRGVRNALNELTGRID